jgi:putative SOS response-associated peptidase YedK
MCGRYTLNRRQEEIELAFDVEKVVAQAVARCNVSPTQSVAVVLDRDDERVLDAFRWGLIPFWTKQVNKSRPMINARAETIAEKPYWKNCIARKRCIVPADGFYEWKKEGKTKTPMFIHLSDRSIFGFAGLWDEWKSPDGEVIRSCSIITTAANHAIQPVHDRMPVMLRASDIASWLNPSLTKTADVVPLLQARGDEEIGMYAVSTRVNSPAYDGPDVLEPVDQEPVAT